jgi:hypothetical protein
LRNRKAAETAKAAAPARSESTLWICRAGRA